MTNLRTYLVKVLGIIPSRSGSKRVFKKNVKLLAGQPLITYTFKEAKQASLLTRLIVSTNDPLVMEIAQKEGIELPYKRPEEFCTDTSSDYDVILHAVNFFAQQGEVFDAIAYLRPTSPFKSALLIDNCIRQLQSSSTLTSVRTVTSSTGVFHPFWMYRSEGEELRPFIEGVKISDYYQSQLLPKCFRLNGVVDILKTENLMAGKDIYGSSIGFQELTEEQSMDIDTEYDFKLCEFLMSQQRGSL